MTFFYSGSQGLTQSQLAVCMASDPNTVSSLVKRMEASGLIARTRDPSDRRAHRIRLTASGLKSYRKRRPIALELQARVLAALPEKERKIFLAHLEKIAEACRQLAEESAPESG